MTPYDQYKTEQMEWIYDSTFFRRTRLLNRLGRDKHTQLIGIYANYGFGKTFLMCNYIAESKSPCIWYNLDNFKTCDEKLIQAIRSKIYEVIYRKKYVENENGEPVNSFESCLAEISKYFGDYNGHLFLVFDNFHALKDASSLIFLILQLLVLNISGLTIAILSHSEPEYPFLELRICQKYVIIKENELKLTPEETSAFFNEYNSHDLSEIELNVIRARIDGWITGYQLVSDYLYKQSSLKKEDIAFSDIFNTVPDIFNYFSKVIFESQPPKIQVFLERTSLLVNLDPSIIDLYLETDDAAHILRNLCENNVFINASEKNNIRYFEPFRNFLHYTYLQKDKSQVLHDHRILTDIFYRRHDYYDAYVHAFLGKDFPRAKQLMKVLVKQYGASSVLDVLEERLEGTSNSVIAPDSTYYLIFTISYDVLYEILPSIQEYTLFLKEHNRISELLNMQLILGYIYLAIGQVMNSADTFQTAIQYASTTSNYKVAALAYNMLIDCHILLKNDEAALHAAKEGLYLAGKYHYDQIRAQILDSVAQLYLQLKKVDEAQNCLRDGFACADTFSKLWLLVTKAALLNQISSYKEAAELAKESLESAEIYACDYAKIKAYMVMGNSYFALGDMKNGEENFLLAEKYGDQSPILQCNVLNALVNLYICAGNISAARETARRLMDIVKEKDLGWYVNTHNIAPIDKLLQSQEPVKIQVRMLGTFWIGIEGEEIQINRRSSIRMLLYLLSHRSRRVSRDEIIENVFEDKGGTINNFNVVLSTLRKALDTVKIRERYKTSILRFGDSYQINKVCFSIDVDQYYALITDGREISLTFQSCCEAEKLYQGTYCETNY